VLPYSYTDKTKSKLLHKSWKGHFASIAEYNQGDCKFTGKPKILGYKPKDGNCVVIFTPQATSKNLHYPGQIELSTTYYNFNTQLT